jgi:conjugal transfer pilus assembly protein TraE
MKLGNYARTFAGAVQENRHTRWLVVGLLASNLLLILVLLTRSETVVMVPPDLPERSVISESSASAGLKEMWGTYVATLLGNVTPTTAASVAKNFSRIVAPSAYHQLLDEVSRETKLMESDQVTTQFVPSQVFWLPSKDIVVVSGECTLRGLRDNERRLVRTFEVGIDIRNYMISVRSLRVYDGPWSPTGPDDRGSNPTQATGQPATNGDDT